MKNKPNVETPPHLTHGSVLDDLGFTPAETLAIKVKADVYRDLMSYIRSQAYTPRQLETLLGIPQSDVSNLVNGRVAKFSVAKLIKFAGKLNLGAEVRLTIPKPAGAMHISASGMALRKRSSTLVR
jgi:predicted XRE-type DNA-binding protein